MTINIILYFFYTLSKCAIHLDLRSPWYSCTQFDKSNPVINEKVKTNDYGEISMELKNISKSNYTVNVTFEGNNEFKKCSVEQNLKIVDDAIVVLSHDNTPTNVDSGSFYTQQAGKIIYTGEVQLATAGHYWKHICNNEWVRID